MASRTRWIGAVAAAFVVAWFIMDEVESAPDPYPRIRRPTPQNHRPTRVLLPAAHPDDEPPRDKIRITVHLTRSDRLRQLFDVPPTFEPSALIPLPDEGLLPDADAVDALQDVLAADDDDRPEAIDDFLDAVYDSEALPGDSGNPWAAVVELEAERLAIEADFVLDQEHEMAVLRRAHRTGRADDFQALNDLPLAAKRNEELVEVCLEIANEHLDSPVGSIARLYAAQAYSDWDSDVYNEHTTQQVLLSALHNTEDPIIIDQAIEMLTPLVSTVLEPEDISMLEESWDVVDPELRAPLARFLLDQRYAVGDPSEASAWADQLEAELLAGHEWGSDTGNRWWELNEARDRLSAKMDLPATDWRDGFNRITRQCWDSGDTTQTAAPNVSPILQWAWDGAWEMTSKANEGPLTHCILEQSHRVPAPDVPMDVELVLSIEGSAR